MSNVRRVSPLLFSLVTLVSARQAEAKKVAKPSDSADSAVAPFVPPAGSPQIVPPAGSPPVVTTQPPNTRPQHEPHEEGGNADMPPRHQPPPDDEKPEGEFKGTHGRDLRIVGTGELFYSYNLNNPSNGITNARGFDNRHNTFAFSNLSFGFEGELERVAGKVILQYGLTPDTYYASEPNRAGGELASGTSASTWKFIQEANVSVDLSRPVAIEGGLFLSPIGPETIPVAKNWNWSRSNLFFALPYYHTGLRLLYRTEDKYKVNEEGREVVCMNEIGARVPCPGREASIEAKDGWTFSLGVYNGWNNVIDNNPAKSVALGADFSRSRKIEGVDTETLYFHALYFGGIERSSGDRNGAYWRNDLDLTLRGRLGEAVSVMAHANGGVEPTRFGPSWWAGAALYGRLAFNDWLGLAARVDGLRQREGKDASGSATPLFFSGARWVSSGTLTLEAKATKIASIRLEYRHDEAERPLFFFSQVQGDGGANPFVPNSVRQDTILLGVAANCCDVR